MAATPGGRDSVKFAMLPNVPVPVYLIRVNCAGLQIQNQLMLITMLEPGAEMPPERLMAGAVGLAVSEPPKSKVLVALSWKVRLPEALMPLAALLSARLNVELAATTTLLAGSGLPEEATANNVAPLVTTRSRPELMARLTRCSN